MSELKAPFPYFGGKSMIAADVWERFGNVGNYAEPFFGSGAVLLSRPAGHLQDDPIETVNDLDGMVCNFWRSLQHDPDAVAHYADAPVNENDLHAKHIWLVNRKGDLTSRLEGDPDYYDPKAAGWWVWGICSWIGGGWCSGNGPWQSVDGQLVHLGGGQGINRKLVHLGGGQGINRQLVHLGDAGRGACAEWTEHLRQMMRELADRLRRVRVCCGDWTRVCGPSPTEKLGLTGVFLDPPYSHSERDNTLYAEDHDVGREVREWAIAHGDNPLMRIALCDYGEAAGEMPSSWQRVDWKTKGGYGSQGNGRGKTNASRETIWFSPHCLKPDRAVQGSLL